MSEMGQMFFRLFLLLLMYIVTRNHHEVTCLFMAAEADTQYTVAMSDLTVLKFHNKTVPPRMKGPDQLIPYMIHQTNQQDAVPSDMLMAIESVIQHNPQYEYRYYNGQERREFIKQHMGSTILQCYDRLVPRAFKADLFRYSVVYTLGGCYMDIGFVFVDHLRNTIRPDDIFLSTQDGGGKGQANPAFFCATKKNPIIKEVLNVAVKHVANSRYGNDPLDITGPRVFGRGFRYYFHDVDLVIRPNDYGGGVRLIRQNLDPRCRLYDITDLPRNEILTHHKYVRYSQDMNTFNTQGHYNHFYNTKTIYNQSVSVVSDGDYDLSPDPLNK